MTEPIYHRIDCADWRKVWIVGDIHGNTAILMAMLDAAGFDFSQDLLVSTGDLIDRGPDSLGALRLTTLNWFRTVRGNHEQMAYDGLILNDSAMFRCWMDNGGIWFLGLDVEQDAEATSLIRRINTLPHVLELRRGDDVIVVCHGDYPGRCYRYGRSVDTDRILWGRERLDDILEGKPRPLSGATEFYFGHTPVRTHSVSGNLHYIDTGAGFGRPPTLFCLKEQ